MGSAPYMSIACLLWDFCKFVAMAKKRSGINRSKIGCEKKSSFISNRLSRSQIASMIAQDTDLTKSQVFDVIGSLVKYY